MQNREKDTDVQNRLLDSVGEDKGGMFWKNSMYIIYSETDHSPGWMHETSALAWCTGKTQRNRVEREVGGVIGMGNTCNSMADSCQCMTKPTEMLWSNSPPTNKNKLKKKKDNPANDIVDILWCH